LVATSGSLQGLTRLVVGPDLKLVQHVYLLVQLQGFMISTGCYYVAYEASFCSCWLDFDKEAQAVRFLSGPQEECTPGLCYFRGRYKTTAPELSTVRPRRERGVIVMMGSWQAAAGQKQRLPAPSCPRYQAPAFLPV
jgi:hypothetical protein